MTTRNLLPANGYLHFRHQTTDAYNVNSAHQLISPTDASNHIMALLLGSAAGPEKQAIHLSERNSMMAPRSSNAANLLSINPLFDGGKADPQL